MITKCPKCEANIWVDIAPLKFPLVEGLSTAEAAFINDMVKHWNDISPEEGGEKLKHFLLVLRQELNEST